MKELTDIRGVGPVLAQRLAEVGLQGPADIANADMSALTGVKGVTAAKAQAFQAEAAALIRAQKQKAKDRKRAKANKKAVAEFEKELKKAAKKAAKKANKKARKAADKKQS